MIRELSALARISLGKIALSILMMSLACIARAQEDAAAVQPPPADATAMIAFLFIFLGMIAAYVAWIFYQQKKRKKAEMGRPDKA